ncbi:MAG: BMP family ABC transporter substrate-binding protein [Lachnospiraceae bacterium]|nr:BMP family ABC transporter substrate-binding protein [Lachnospiraceae bacterium]
MSKKLCMIFTVLAVLTFSLVGCGSKTDSNGAGKPELALVTALNSIDDKSFNQGSWEGLKQYAEEKEISYKYYESPDSSETSVQATIALAITGGAKVVVCPGYLFEVPLYNVQDQYPDVTFVLLDGTPNDGNGNVKIGDNVICYTYAEEQAGFLAGYAAVMDGNRALGFMGGVAAPAVVRFGYGYVQGAEYAAKELGLTAGEVSIDYTYVGNFDASPENQAIAASWFNKGTDIIFGCGGNVGNSVMSAAETAGKKVIGVDTDQSVESSTVITSAMKNLTKTVYDALAAHYTGTLETGVCENLDVTTNSVLLPMETSVFESFTKEQYNAIYEELAAGNIEILGNTAVDSVMELPVELVTVSEL